MLLARFTHRTVGLIGISLQVLSFIGLAYSFNFVTMLVFYSIPGGKYVKENGCIYSVSADLAL